MPNNDNIVYEISRLVNDKNILRRDMNDAAGLVMEMFKKKYVNRLGDKISEYRLDLQKNPPKEVQLINALRQFMPESERHAADKAIEVFIMADTITKLRQETALGAAEHVRIEEAAKPEALAEVLADTQAQTNVQTSSVHEDGVYDIDENCMKKKSMSEAAGMLMVAGMLMSTGMLDNGQRQKHGMHSKTR